MDVKQYLLVLICISLMANNTEHFFICLLIICVISCREMAILTPRLFFNWVIYLLSGHAFFMRYLLGIYYCSGSVLVPVVGSKSTRNISQFPNMPWPGVWKCYVKIWLCECIPWLCPLKMANFYEPFYRETEACGRRCAHFAQLQPWWKQSCFLFLGHKPCCLSQVSATLAFPFAQRFTKRHKNCLLPWNWTFLKINSHAS